MSQPQYLHASLPSFEPFSTIKNIFVARKWKVLLPHASNLNHLCPLHTASSLGTLTVMLRQSGKVPSCKYAA